MAATTRNTSFVRWRLGAIALAVLALLAARSALAQVTPPLPAYPDHGDLSYYLDESGGRVPIRSPADWDRRRGHIRAALAAVMGTLPARDSLPPLDVRIDQTTPGDGWTRYHLSYQAEPGDRVPAYLFVPAEARPHATPAIVALHQTIACGKDEPAGLAGSPNLHYGLELARRGYVVFCPDYPSFGEYEYDFARSGHPSGTIKGVLNHVRGVDVLAAREEVDPARIGAIGHSLGGHNAIFLAALDERIAVAVSSCGWTPFHDYYGGKLAGWSGDRYMPRIRQQYDNDPNRVPFDFPELIAALAPRAFFSASPLDDDNFAVAGVRKGIAAARPIYELHGAAERLQVRYPAAPHDFPADMRQEAYAFLDRVLSHEPPATDIGEELPRIPPREPAQALAAFDIVSGFRVELAAAEPELASPVAVAFDEAARMYVVEMRDYSEQATEHLGRVRLLADVDGDGRYEQSTVFAEGLSWPTAVACWDGGVFVGAAPDIWYLKDDDGDGVADTRRRVYTGFGRGNVQGLLNSFQWGLDNRIYGATSSAGGNVRRADDPQARPLALTGRDFSFDPRTLELRPETGGAQHGLSFDDWGRRFVCSNSDHLQLIACEDRYLAANPFVAAPGARTSIAADGPQAAVFRTSPVEPWRVVRTRLRVAGQVPGPIEGGGRPAGYFTSATGVTVYRGDAWPEEFRGQVFVGDVGSNIVHRKVLEPAGAALVGRRIDEGREFLASSDIWFRPAQFANGPDGALYIVDMYREVIEHPESLPPIIKRHLDLTSGRDRGRIWRIVRADAPRRPPTKLAGATTDELVAALASPNGWTRDTAARLLIERRDPSAVPQLAALLRSAKLPQARLQALCTLAGLTTLNAEQLVRRLADEHPLVRRQAVRLAESQLQDAVIAELLQRAATETEATVRYQLALSAAGLPKTQRLQLLAALVRHGALDAWSELAVQLAAGDGAGELLALLVAEPSLAADERRRLGAQLADQVGRRGAAEEVDAAVQAIERALASDGDAASVGAIPAAQAALAALAGGLKASRSARAADYLAPSGTVGRLVGQAVSAALQRLTLDGRSPADRAESARLLALGSFTHVREALLRLLESREAPEVQLAAIEALGRFNEPAVAEALIDAWPSLGPRQRTAATDVLFSREAWLLATLDRLPAAQLDAARTALLARHPSGDVRRRWQALVGEQTARPRAEIVDRYRAALERTGDVQHGRELFGKHCGSCHRVEGVGHEIGPNLAAMRSRGAEAILLAVLDPNREVNPQYQAYTLVTSDGRTLTGIVAESASSVTVRRADDVADTVLRSEIDQLAATGVSLMPEGLEQQIDLPAMADLVAYLMSLK